MYILLKNVYQLSHSRYRINEEIVAKNEQQIFGVSVLVIHAVVVDRVCIILSSRTYVENYTNTFAETSPQQPVNQNYVRYFSSLQKAGFKCFWFLCVCVWFVLLVNFAVVCDAVNK